MSDASTDAGSRPAPSGRRLLWPGGLSARLLILTVLIALAAALLILVPSLADYQENGYLDRVRAAELASLTVDVAPARTVSAAIKTQLLRAAGVVSVAVQSEGVRRLEVEAARMPRTPELVDLRNRSMARVSLRIGRTRKASSSMNSPAPATAAMNSAIQTTRRR